MKTRILGIVSLIVRWTKKVLNIHKLTDAEREYIKSRHRCPICGTLVGCDSLGNTGAFSTKVFYKHLVQCRRLNRVKPGRIRYEEER